MKLNPIKSVKAGFSLVEMLVVIAVIGIIAAIAVPNIGRINDAAKDATYKRNAQNIASVFASAQAAGYDFSKTAGTGVVLANEAAIIGAVVTGATLTGANFTASPFNGAFFGVPGLKLADAQSKTAGAGKYLTWNAAQGQLNYTGGQ
jgi:prepilin-type N-terminal cleavage/methylation domain-containing protein